MQRTLFVQAVLHLVHWRCITADVGTVFNVSFVVVDLAPRVRLLQQVGIIPQLPAEVLRQVFDEAVKDVVLQGEELFPGSSLEVVVSLRMQQHSLRLSLPRRHPEPSGHGEHLTVALTVDIVRAVEVGTLEGKIMKIAKMGRNIQPNSVSRI